MSPSSLRAFGAGLGTPTTLARPRRPQPTARVRSDPLHLGRAVARTERRKEAQGQPSVEKVQERGAMLRALRRQQELAHRSKLHVSCHFHSSRPRLQWIRIRLASILRSLGLVPLSMLDHVEPFPRKAGIRSWVCILDGQCIA
ncbi:hypothetical protein L1887_56016 [Cichorium endivia]|nr:hypothetical protein L1887_56016 [Cichorium endivia]